MLCRCVIASLSALERFIVRRIKNATCWRAGEFKIFFKRRLFSG
jgi:hypothetical protein